MTVVVDERTGGAGACTRADHRGRGGCWRKRTPQRRRPSSRHSRNPSCSGSSCPRSSAGSTPTSALRSAVFEALAYADGSTGWSVMANSTSSCFAAIYTGEAAAKAMFTSGGRGIHAGMLGPVGSARRVDGGYQVSGQVPVRLRVCARELHRRGDDRDRRRRATSSRPRPVFLPCGSC